MKVLSVLLVCTFLDNMATTEGSAILKALVGRPESGSQNRHRHGHGYDHQRRQQVAQDTQVTPHQAPDTHQQLLNELNNELRLGLPMNPTLLSSRVSFGRVKPQLPPLEMRVDADSSWVGGGKRLDDPQLQEEELQEELQEQLVGQDNPDLPSRNTHPQGTEQHTGSPPTVAAEQHTGSPPTVAAEQHTGSPPTVAAEQHTGSPPTVAANITHVVYNGSTSPTTPPRQPPTRPATRHHDDGSGDESSGDSAQDARVLPAAPRARRSLTADLVQVPVCESVSEWVERSAAEDMWGNTVRVLQEIDIGGTQVNQYFYETYCREKRASCVGIDTSRYRSVCRNKHMWAYAKVEARSGDVGWNLIRIRGSCNCALYSRYPKGHFDITQLIGKR